MRMLERWKRPAAVAGSLGVALGLCLTGCDRSGYEGGTAGDALEDAGDRVEDATDRADDEWRTRDNQVLTTNEERSLERAAENTKEAAKDAARSIGRGLDRAGEEMQDAAK